MKTFNELVTENAWNQLGQKKPVGDILPAPAKGVVPKHGKKFEEGDSVTPHTGPHAGERHVVTSSRAGGVNMVYRGKSGNDKYNSITVRAKHEHLSPYKKPVAEAYDEYGMYMGMDDYEDEEDYQDEGEYDYEGDMAMSQLRTIIRNAETMLGMMERDTNLPEWVQSKITLAEDYVVSSSNYLMSRYDENF
jgi:hypothetical protein